MKHDLALGLGCRGQGGIIAPRRLLLLEARMPSKLSPSRRSPAAHKAANARWYAAHAAELAAKRRARVAADPAKAKSQRRARYLRERDARKPMRKPKDGQT